MAITNNILMKGLSGHINKQLVAKYYRKSGKTVITKFPDMSGIVFNEKQKASQSNFKEAQRQRTVLLKDPVARAEWELRCPPEQRLCDFILSELMKKEK